MEKFGRYEIISELGRGGMAYVYHAYDPDFDREVAVKVLPREFLHDPNFRARFLREARALAALAHPAIVPVYDIGEEEGQPFLVLSYMPGGSLAARIVLGPLALQETANIVARIAPALDYAHQRGVIHRDLKPGNILFDAFNNAYLSDFGIVRLSEATAELTGSGILGTPAYMAPEMAEAAEPTHLVDIYALGVTVYRMLSGRLPYDASTPMGQIAAHITKPIPNIRAANPGLPPPTQEVIDTVLAKDPAARYSSAADFSAALDDLVAGQESRSSLEETQPLIMPEAVEAARLEAALVSEAEVSPRAPTQGSAPPVAKRRWRPSRLQTGILLAGMAFSLVLVAVVVFSVLNLPRLWGSAGARPDVDVPRHIAAPAEAGVADNPQWQDNDWWPYTKTIDGAEMALVPAGCFMRGSTDGDFDEAPVREICFDKPFWIDVYEVTNQQYGSTLSECESISSDADQPRVCVTWKQAATHCESRGARLPTEAEWEYAARGPDDLVYPWGDTFDGHLANICDSQCLHDWADTDLDDGYRYAAPVGSYPGGISWVGAFDLTGNAWEWVNDWYAEETYRTLADGVVNPQGPDSGDKKVLRGGSWAEDADSLRAANRIEYVAEGSIPNFGFRCARDYRP